MYYYICQLPVNLTALCRNKNYTNTQLHNQAAPMTGYKVQPYIKSFFKNITLQQLQSLHLGSPDNGSTILLMDMILRLILDVTESLIKNVVTIGINHLEENAEMCLERSLLWNLSEALDVPAENRSLRILKTMIWHEAKESAVFFLTHVEHSDINIQILPLSKLNRMASLFIKLFKEFGPGVSITKSKQRHRDVTEWVAKTGDKWKISGRPEEVETERSETSVQNEVTRKLSNISAFLLNDVSSCFYAEIQSAICLEIQSFAREPSSVMGKDSNKIHYFCSKWFFKVWLCRMLQRLNRKYPEDTKAGRLEIIDSIIKGLVSTHFENLEPTNADSLQVMFTAFPGDKIQDFTEELRDLIFKHVLVEKKQESIFKDYCQRSWSNPKPQAGIDIDIWRDACVCIAIVNWFHKSQTEGVVDVPSADAVYKLNASRLQREDDAELQITKVYVNLFVEKVVFHICSEAKVMVENKEELLDSLFESIWPKVRNEKICITHKSFRKLDETIHRGLCKKYGLIEVMTLTSALHPAIVDFLISFIRKKLLTPDRTKNWNHMKRFLSTVGSQIENSFCVLCDKKMSDVHLLN